MWPDPPENEDRPERTDRASGRSDVGPSEGTPEAPHPETEEDSLPTDERGLLFGEYRVIRKLGAGGMGSVWLVEHVRLEQRRALRVIKSDVADSETNRRRFEQEAVILARLSRHPNAVTVHDIGIVGRFAYIEMESIEGQSLRERLDQIGPMPASDVLWILGEVCAVLGEAHRFGIVHGDIKPQKILFVADPSAARGERIKVLDFDLARIIRGVASTPAASPTQDHPGVLGTIPYSSPERLGLLETGRTQDAVDHRSDIYSLGVMLYEMLAGARPFSGTLTKILYDHAHSPPPRIADLAPAVAVPPAVEAVVRRCLEKHPTDRPQSVGELLASFGAAAGVATPPETSLPPPSTARPESTIAQPRAAPNAGIQSVIRRLLDRFRRSPAPGPEVGPPPRAVEGSPTTGGQPASPGIPARPSRPAAGPPSAPRSVPPGRPLDSPSVGRLYVGNLAYNVDDSDLARLFSGFGTVRNAQVIKDRETGRSKGFGFVEMASEADVVAAIEGLHDKEFKGRRLTVNTPRPREPRGGGGSGYGGGGGNRRGGGGRGVRREYGGSDEPPTPPKAIRRHTDVSFPAVVRLGKVYNLRVQLVPAEEALPSGEVRERPRPHPHDATLKLLVSPPPRPGTPPPPIKLAISVAAENFEIEGPSRIEIVVPLEGKSPAASIGLRGLDAGPGRIMVDIAQDGRPVGSVDLLPEVVADLAPSRPPGGLAAASGELSLSLGLGPAPAPPDVILKVFEHRMAGHPGRLQFVLSSSHPALADLPVLDGDLGTLDLHAEVAGWAAEQLRAVGDLAGRADVAIDDAARIVAAVGFNLYQQLLPPAVQELSWTLRRRGIRTLLVLSDEPYIPWELIKPFRADPLTGEILDEEGFWAESYAMARWLRGRPPVSRLAIARVLGVAAGSGGTVPCPVPRPDSAAEPLHSSSTRDMVRIDTLASMAEPPAQPPGTGGVHGGFDRSGEIAAGDEELTILRSLEALGARVERLPALRGAVRQAFEQGSFDLLHLVSHGSFDGLARGDASAVYLDDGAFTAAELSPMMAAALRRSAPLVIFNTCHSGRVGFSLTRLGSWGAHLVRLGCGGFVSALWPVSDRAALAFARAFYEQLARQCPLGEAVRLARLRVREQYPGDPTWLAYSCFADPMARVEAEPTRGLRGRY